MWALGIEKVKGKSGDSFLYLFLFFELEKSVRYERSGYWAAESPAPKGN